MEESFKTEELDECDDDLLVFALKRFEDSRVTTTQTLYHHKKFRRGADDTHSDYGNFDLGANYDTLF